DARWIAEWAKDALQRADMLDRLGLSADWRRALFPAIVEWDPAERNLRLATPRESDAQEEQHLTWLIERHVHGKAIDWIATNSAASPSTVDAAIQAINSRLTGPKDDATENHGG